MPSKTQSILLAGVAVGVAASLFSLIPVQTAAGCLSCLAFLATGLLAVWHYTNTYQLTITGGQGAGLGALAGIVGAIVSSVLTYLFSMIGLTQDWQERMREQFEASGMEEEQLEQVLQYLESPLVLVGGLLFSLILYALVGAIGGAIGASVFKKGRDTFGSAPTGSF